MGLSSSRSCNERDKEESSPEHFDKISPLATSPSKPQPQNHFVRQASVRSRALQPMPESGELDKRFARVLVNLFFLKFFLVALETYLFSNFQASMDLPPDKAKLLKNYDDEKKWDIICDQEMVQAKDPPSHYLTKLRTYLDPKASRSHRVSRHLFLNILKINNNLLLTLLQIFLIEI